VDRVPLLTGLPTTLSRVIGCHIQINEQIVALALALACGPVL
jgi:hypothetical protein